LWTSISKGNNTCSSYVAMRIVVFSWPI
jgi:hypothetical protein